MGDRYIKGIRIDWSKIKKHQYLMKIPALQPLQELWFHSNVTFFVGENGAGKSTLLEAIAVSYGFNPEAALSPQRQLVLLLRLWELAKKGAQFIIATHSPILLGLPGASILSFDGDHLREIEYEESDCYRTMELFINHKTTMLRELLEGDYDDFNRSD